MKSKPTPKKEQALEEKVAIVKPLLETTANRVEKLSALVTVVDKRNGTQYGRAKSYTGAIANIHNAQLRVWINKGKSGNRPSAYEIQVKLVDGSRWEYDGSWSMDPLRRALKERKKATKVVKAATA
jgi:hypothetical protein